MSRTRILSTFAAIVAVAVACTGLALITAPANASPERVAKVTRPKVGQCRTTTYSQGFAVADPRKPVPCSQPHTMKTFAVVTIPKRISLKNVNGRKLNAFIVNACFSQFRKALGGSYSARAQSAYSVWSFLPTKAQRKKGARWVRCDLSLSGATSTGVGFLPSLPNLSFPMVGSRPITDATRRCLATADHDYWTICAKPHVARADQTFVFANPTAQYPTQAAINAQAATQCPGKRALGQGSWEWTHGDHVITCYSSTTS